MTWQPFGGLEYRFTQHWSFRAGYRALGVDIEKRDIKLDAVLHGLVSAWASASSRVLPR